MADAVTPVLAQDPTFSTLARLSERLMTLDIRRLLIYLVDLVEEDALPCLGEQFHIMGDEGWNFAADDAARRALIKAAIELHRYKGTPWAVRQALDVLGFEVELIDQQAQRHLYAAHNPARLDGSWTLDGARVIRAIEQLTGLPQLQHWAQFIVRVNLAQLTQPASIERLRALIDAWKPVRSWPLFVFWLRIRVDVPLALSTRLVMQKHISARYPWCGRVISARPDARWALSVDGQPARLAAPFGSFAVGRRYGQRIDWALTGCRNASHATLTSRSAVPMWPRETLPADAFVRTPTPVKLFRHALRLDGAWRIGAAIRLDNSDLSGAIPLPRHPMGIAPRLGAFTLYEPVRDMPDPRPSRLSLSGRWRLGGPVNPGFRTQSTRTAHV